jgi:hypothetical protein
VARTYSKWADITLYTSAAVAIIGLVAAAITGNGYWGALIMLSGILFVTAIVLAERSWKHHKAAFDERLQEPLDE